MKANEVLRLLQISRPTLHRWREAGVLKATKLPNGQYNWDEESVFAVLNKGEKRGVYLYARVSTPKQKHDLENQMEALQNFAHEASKRIVKFALSHELNTIIIGKNKGQKRSAIMGRRNNQNFIGIPYQKIIEMIEYKANLVGIAVIQHNEAYTSQTSFLDGEAPVNGNGDKARKRRGLSPARRRIKRGLFRSNNGTLINADVNGALQILRKVVPNAFADGMEGIGLCPVKLNLSF